MLTTRIGGSMEPAVEERVIECVIRNKNIFTFKPTDLKGVDPKIAVHILHEDPSVRPIKKKLRRFGVEKDKIIQEEV